MSMSHQQFLAGSIARFQLLELAAALGWPRIQYPRVYGTPTVFEIAGELQWRSAGFGNPAAIREAYTQLLKIEHERSER